MSYFEGRKSVDVNVRGCLADRATEVQVGFAGVGWVDATLHTHFSCAPHHRFVHAAGDFF